jgi:hypothetical protein
MFTTIPFRNFHLLVCCPKSKNQNYNLATVLYGCETWPLTLRYEHRLRAFENRVLRRISGLKSDETVGG